MDWVERYHQLKRSQQDQKGGPGSGHHGHAGRPGKVGGSEAGGKRKVVTSRSISNTDAVDLALEINWTMSPTSDLVMAIRQKFKCSDAVAGKVYSRITNPKKPLIRQVHKTEWQKLPPGSMSYGGLSVPTGLSKWERIEYE